MKKYYLNGLLLILFIISLFLSDYLFLALGKTNFYNYQNNNVDITILQNENKVLKEELEKSLALNNLETYNNFNYLKTQILLRDVYNFHETITIKYGQNQNLKKGMAVVSDKGLVGIIKKVHKKTSVVQLLTAKDSSISIKIGDSYGALDAYDQAKNNLIAHNFNNYEVIMKSEEVYTSGLGLIPEGIYIGKVQNSKDMPENIEQEVIIKSDVDFANLKYLAIIKGIKEL